MSERDITFLGSLPQGQVFNWYRWRQPRAESTVQGTQSRVKVKPSSKYDTVTRCAFCHDPDGKLDKCSGCGTLTHEECRVEFKGCATMGCIQPIRSEPIRPVPTAWGWNYPRREALYDTETFPGAIQFGTLNQNYLAVATAGTNLNQNYQAFATTTIVQNPAPPYYYTQYLDGILTRPVAHEAFNATDHGSPEMQVTDALEQSREQF